VEYQNMMMMIIIITTIIITPVTTFTAPLPESSGVYRLERKACPNMANKNDLYKTNRIIHSGYYPRLQESLQMFNLPPELYIF
jgi:hypothetical protein